MFNSGKKKFNSNNKIANLRLELSNFDVPKQKSQPAEEKLPEYPYYTSSANLQRLVQSMEAHTGESTRIADDLANAKAEKDFSENGGLSAAIQEGNLLAESLETMQNKINRAVIVKRPSNNLVIQPGHIVTVQHNDDPEGVVHKYMLISHQHPEATKHGVMCLDPNASLGKELLGKTLANAAITWDNTDSSKRGREYAPSSPVMRQVKPTLYEPITKISGRIIKIETPEFKI